MTSSITPLRVSPGVTPDAHPSIATGHSCSKFGPPAGATATDRLIERTAARGSVRLRGIHMHLGSQIRDMRVYETAVRTAAPYLRARDLLLRRRVWSARPGQPHGPARPVTVAGKHCESGEVLAEGVMPPKNLPPGVVVCSPVTGAYGYSMASSYNRLGRPAVVFASGGRATTALHRETPADLMQLDVWPSRQEDS